MSSEHGRARDREDTAVGRNAVRSLLVCGVYSVAMAYVESAVVVYLRKVLHVTGDLFPLAPLPPALLRIELARELATIVMLATVALLVSRRPRIAFTYFLYCFGIWDLFYYAWLKILVGWPSSLLSWDVLFLVPVPWFGPVLSPALVSLLFIVRGLIVVRLEALGRRVRISFPDVVLGAAGAVLVIGSYVWSLPAVAQTGVPSGYPWWLFGLGCALWAASAVRRIVASRRSR